MQGVRQSADVLMDLYRRGFKSEALCEIHKFSGPNLNLLLEYMWGEPITELTRSRVMSYIQGIGYDLDYGGLSPYINS